MKENLAFLRTLKNQYSVIPAEEPESDKMFLFNEMPDQVRHDKGKKDRFFKGHLFLTVLFLALCGTIFTAEKSEEQLFFNNDNYFLRAEYSFPSEGKFDGGLAFSVGKTFNLISKLNLEIEGGLSLMKSNFERDETSDSIGTGNLTLVSVNLNLNYYLLSSASLGIYLKAGGGYSFNGFSATNAYEELGFVINEDLDNSFQFQFGTGADFEISDSIILNLDLRYTLCSTSGTWSVRDEGSGAEVTGSSEVTLNSFTAMLGIKIY